MPVMPAARPQPANPRRRAALTGAAIAVLTFLLYLPALRFDFINYDDPDYVTANPMVQAGFTGAGFKWAFTTFHSGNWHPLTWLSHMADAQFSGLDAGAHHRTNALLHALTALALFLALHRMTGALWRCASVAALFAWHPQRVESVAWVAERKDVLCALFWMLTLLAYARYVEKPSPLRYAPVILAFVLGALSKPMIVTLPFALLLLDVWPLKRLPLPPDPHWARQARKLGLEKLPLFALTVALGGVTYHAQQGSGFIVEGAPLAERLGNSLLSYGEYLWKTVWPASLALPYPPRDDLAPGQIALAVAVLGGITIAVFRFGRERAYLVSGWLWFLGTLVPVVGFVPIGAQAMADRYSYVPGIGLLVAVVWLLGDVLGKGESGRRVLIAAAVAVSVTWMTWTRQQLSVWRNTETLFRHSLAVTTGNARAHFMLGLDLLERKQAEAAVAEFRAGLRFRPTDHLGHFHLARALEASGQPREALRHYAAAVEGEPRLTEAWFRAGVLLAQSGQPAAAIEAFKRLLEADPNDLAALMNTGTLRLQTGAADLAVPYFSRVLVLEPRHAEARFSLALALRRSGRAAEAVPHFQEAIALRPGWPPPLIELARLRATHPEAALRNGTEALRAAELAVNATQGRDAAALDALAAALAETGRFGEAVSTAQRALETARQTGDSALIQQLTRRLGIYQANQPVREN